MRKFILTAATAALLAAGPAFASDDSTTGLAIGTALGTTPDSIKAALTEMGWEVRKLDMEDGMIEAYAVMGNQTAEIYVDPTTGMVVKGRDND